MGTPASLQSALAGGIYAPAATRRLIVVALLFVIALGAGLRCVGLGSESLWLDEATSLILAQNRPAQLIALTAADIHPPLYYLLLRSWLVFGTSEAALRSFSAIIGALTILALYDLGRQLFGRQVGLVAALLLAVSPLHVWYSQEARMYALATLWATLSSGLMLRALRQGRWPAWAGYVIVVALGMYTHYYMGFVVLAQNACVAYLWLRGRLQRGDLWRWVAAQAGWLALFAPWIPTVIQQVTSGGGAWVEQGVGRPSWRALADVYIAYSLGTLRASFPGWMRRGVYATYGLGLLAAVWATLRPAPPARRERESWSAGDAGMLVFVLGVLPLVVAWLVAQAKPIFALRYLLPFLPPFCLLLALGVRQLMGWKRGAGWALLLLLLAPALWGCRLQAITLEKEDWRGLTARLLQEAGAGAVVMPEPFWNAKPLRYYAGTRLIIDDGAPLPATPAGVEAAARAALGRGGGRLWLVESVGHYGDPARLLAGHLDEHCEVAAHFTYPGIGLITHFICVGY